MHDLGGFELLNLLLLVIYLHVVANNKLWPFAYGKPRFLWIYLSWNNSKSYFLIFCIINLKRKADTSGTVGIIFCSPFQLGLFGRFSMGIFCHIIMLRHLNRTLLDSKVKIWWSYLLWFWSMNNFQHNVTDDTLIFLKIFRLSRTPLDQCWYSALCFISTDQTVKPLELFC
jgi:hypothetical protein